LVRFECRIASQRDDLDAVDSRCLEVNCACDLSGSLRPLA